MATTTKAAAKKPTAKAPQAKAAAGTVATPPKDEAADLAALSNQGSGDSSKTTATDGAQGVTGQGGAPNTSPADGAGTAPGAGATGLTTPPDSTEGGTTAPGALSDEQVAAAALLAASQEVGEGDEPDLAALLTRTLVNQTASTRRLPRLGVVIEPGASLLIGFRDEAHQAACERHIEQLRELGGWEEGCGLHWGLDE